jgi:hypothetical protein
VSAIAQEDYKRELLKRLAPYANPNQYTTSFRLSTETWEGATENHDYYFGISKNHAYYRTDETELVISNNILFEIDYKDKFVRILQNEYPAENFRVKSNISTEIEAFDSIKMTQKDGFCKFECRNTETIGITVFYTFKNNYLVSSQTIYDEIFKINYDIRSILFELKSWESGKYTGPTLKSVFKSFQSNTYILNSTYKQFTLIDNQL